MNLYNSTLFYNEPPGQLIFKVIINDLRNKARYPHFKLMTTPNYISLQTCKKKRMENALRSYILNINRDQKYKALEFKELENQVKEI